MRTVKSRAGYSGAFETDVANVLNRLRSGLSEVIEALPGQIAKGADLHRTLQIGTKLSWKIYKIASAANPVAVGLHVPSPANMQTFYKAARKRGVPEELIEAVSRAAADFEALVAVHSDDRATFDSMVSSLGAEESTEQIDLVHRRLAFRGQRHILGTQAKTQLKFVAMQPSEDPMQMDVVRVEGFIGLRRLRGDAPLVVSYSGARKDDGSPLALRREPLDPISDPHGLALLRPFCSQPLPEFHAVEAGPGFVKGELITRDVGNRAAVDCVEGHVTPVAHPRFSEKDHRILGTAITVRTPCEVLVLDMMLRHDAYGRVNPTAFIHAEHLGEMAWDGVIQRRHLLPGNPKVNYLGRGPSVLHTPDVPRYAELARYVYDRLGWNGDDFDIYRCRFEYPVMPSSVVMRFDLPEAPTQ